MNEIDFSKKKPVTARLFKRAVGPVALAGAVLAFFQLAAMAGTTDTNQLSKSSDNFGGLTLEQLVEVKVTSVSKKEENLNDAAAAIFVLNNDDLRRAGATTLPDALRLVPGMDVGAVNASQWAVSSRGFNSVYASKLLVLVDGRAVYNPGFSGVVWDLQHPMMEDLDRIEVIRGPGATLWGANAVNGVINVVSRSAKDTQGTLLYGGGGDVHQAMTGARYGGQIGDNTYYRVFGSYELNDDYHLANGQSAKDGWQSGQGGFRVDHYPQPDTHLTWQADSTVSDLDDHLSEDYSVNTLGRWTRQLGERSSAEVQAYYDHTDYGHPSQLDFTFDTLDLTAQHTFGLGERNDVIWGLGYRLLFTHYDQTMPLLQVPHGEADRQLFNAFVQDEFKLVPDKLTLTAGTKIEHNDFTGFEIEPNVRATFKPCEQQTVWAAVSRSVRTPAEFDARNSFGSVVAPPIVGPGGGLYIPTLVGNPAVKSEELWAYELGYRIQPARRVSVDLASFYNQYSHLINWGQTVQFVPGSPVGIVEIPTENYLHGDTYGGEASVTVAPTDAWRLTASYSLILGSAITRQGLITTTAPRHQAMLRSACDFTKHISLDAQLRYVDSIPSVSSYVTADARLSWRPNGHLEVSLVGENLLSRQHFEQGSALFVVASEVPRGFYGMVTWRF